MPLDTTPRLDDPDALFAALAEAHRGLDPAVSRRLDAAIVLLLANHIGEVRVAIQAIAQARALAEAHVFGRDEDPAVPATPHPGGTP